MSLLSHMSRVVCVLLVWVLAVGSLAIPIAMVSRNMSMTTLEILLAWNCVIFLASGIRYAIILDDPNYTTPACLSTKPHPLMLDLVVASQYVGFLLATIISLDELEMIPWYGAIFMTTPPILFALTLYLGYNAISYRD
jgi:hypothetical protein